MSLRILLLSTCGALGVGVAIALAWQPPAPASLELTAAPEAAPATAETTSAAKLPDVASDNAPVIVATGALLPAASPPSEPAASPYRDLVANQVEQLDATIQRVEQMAQQDKLNELLGNLQKRLEQSRQAAPAPIPEISAGGQADAEPAPAPGPAPGPPAAALDPLNLSPAPSLQYPALDADSLPVPNNSAPAPNNPATFTRGEGDDDLTINAKDTDIRDVLELLSKQGSLNILASKSVTGTVTASLSGVNVETALASILRSTGFVARREGDIIYVGTPADFSLMDQSGDRILTRVYRPNYIKAADLQTLITPMLTPEVGRVTVSAAAEIDIPANQTNTGGNNFAGTDVVVVRDYEAVLREVDAIFAEVDTMPRQVAIEAMILSVRLNDELSIGVNFDALRDTNNARLVSGTPLASLAEVGVGSGGLKFGFLDSSLGMFINALETVGDTNVIASPRLTCLNKQRAEIQIGEQLGYVNTTVTQTFSTQSVSFLDVGTLLRIRPFIGNDGLIRMEVHPELSTGSVTISNGLTIPNKSVTQVTTNIMCRDGCTAVIGGLIREDLSTTASQIPLIGNLPWVGAAFRQRTGKTSRSELIVLITPRIVGEPAMSQEGIAYGNQFAQRQAVYFDKMSPIGKRNYANHYFRLSRAAFNAGDYTTALKQVNWAIQFDPLNRDAITFRNEVLAAGGFEDESIHKYLKQGLYPGAHAFWPDRSKQGYPWKKPEGFGGEPAVTDDGDLGQTGPASTIVPQPPIPFEPLNVPPLPSLAPVEPPSAPPGVPEEVPFRRLEPSR
jgi:type II secretory pathway component GspD/PulD (secretin)